MIAVLFRVGSAASSIATSGSPGLFNSAGADLTCGSTRAGTQYPGTRLPAAVARRRAGTARRRRLGPLPDPDRAAPQRFSPADCSCGYATH